ncbi:MAG: methionine/alanine import family NSS transporter small subunit [Gemmatimonadetes bacterium]|nr:methionine/alanine import family NSS transporter small subunit [Gemmatimonadota bacterium]
MTTTTIITMVLILGFVWGGLALLILTAARKESAKSGAEGSDAQ